MTFQRNLTFFKKFFTQPGKNASIWPTSNVSAELLCWTIDWSSVTTVLELWPGTGAITKHILKSMSSSASYYGIEYEWEYISLLQERFQKTWSFIHGDVKNLKKILSNHNIANPDLIVSSLSNSFYTQHPWTLQILKDLMTSWTKFRTITYLPSVFLRVFKDLKPRICGYTVKNIPPAYVWWVN